MTVTKLGAVQVWSLDSGDAVRELWPEYVIGRPIVDEDDRAAVSRDGRYVATGSRDGAVRLHDLVAEREVARLMMHGGVTALALDGQQIVVGTENGEVTLARFGDSECHRSAP